MTPQLATSNPEASTRGISVVVPTFNERQNVVPLVEACLDSLHAFDAEVVVVDDDSPDGTWKVARRTFSDDDRVRVVRRTDEKGLATAVLTGFDVARHDLLAVIDADFQHPTDRLPDLANAMLDSDGDVVVGSRYRTGGGIENWSVRRRIVSRAATGLARLAVPAADRTTDPMSGFFVVERDVIEDVRLDPTGYKILLEILAECDVDSVVEVPYTFTDRDRGESNAGLGEYVRFVNHLASCWMRSRDDQQDGGPTPLGGD